MKLNDFRRDAEEYRDVDRAILEKLKPWRVVLNKHRSTWNWFTHNPQGGGFGSNNCGPKYIALGHATRGIPSGTTYELTVNGKRQADQVTP